MNFINHSLDTLVSTCIRSRILRIHALFSPARYRAIAPILLTLRGIDHIGISPGPRVPPGDESDGSARSTYIRVGAIAAVCRVASAETAVDRRARSLARSLRCGNSTVACRILCRARCSFLVPAAWLPFARWDRSR